MKPAPVAGFDAFSLLLGPLGHFSQHFSPSEVRQRATLQSLAMRRSNQRDRLLHRLKRSIDEWVSVREVIEVAGVQYSARICELRQLGHRIESKPGGGWFRLVAPRPVPPLPPTQLNEPRQPSLFGDLRPEPRYPD